MITVDAEEFLRKVSALEGSHLIRFQGGAEDVADRVALVKDVQYHPVTRTLLHVDFYEVDMTEKLRVRVPLHFTGKAVGVSLGGILQPVQREIEAECLPADIPDFIDVDVSHLNIHEAVHISEVQPPAGVRVCYENDTAVVTVLPPTVEEVKITEEAAAPAAAESVVAAEATKPEGKKEA